MWVLIGEAKNFNWSVAEEINKFSFLACGCFSLKILLLGQDTASNFDWLFGTGGDLVVNYDRWNEEKFWKPHSDDRINSISSISYYLEELTFEAEYGVP